jgi:Flp pilus assembly protein CpaB
MFAASEDTGITAQVKDNYRAMQFAIDNNQVLGGTLQAGDHVDLVGTYTVHPPDGQSDFDVSRIIVRDLVVLRAPSTDTTAGKLTASSDKAPVILSVPDTVVPKITFTMHAGDDALWLVLRPGNGSQDGPITLATVQSVIYEGLNSRQILQSFSAKGTGH